MGRLETASMFVVPISLNLPLEFLILHVYPEIYAQPAVSYVTPESNFSRVHFQGSFPRDLSNRCGMKSFVQYMLAD
jgi:hypothetical protein